MILQALCTELRDGACETLLCTQLEGRHSSRNWYWWLNQDPCEEMHGRGLEFSMASPGVKSRYVFLESVVSF